MSTILFSAYFSFRPERLVFMSKVHAALPSTVRPVLFNLAEKVESELEVVNAAMGLSPHVDAPVETLERFLQDEMPELAAQFMEHARGEFEEGARPIEPAVVSLLHRIRSFKNALETYKPSAVFLWNQFNLFHRIAAELLTRREIRFGFFHDGLLPGSIAFDFDGEMGNSWISRDPARFQKVEISENDIQRADAYIRNLNGSEINQRHVQRDDVIVEEALKLKNLNRRPVLFLAGQNDWHAGIKPLCAETVQHSPVFTGSTEALHALDALAGQIGFSIVYKPHPLCRDRNLFLNDAAFPNSLILKSTSLQGCMQASSVVSTIASQTCYAAILAGHPVMMFGRNQITGKNLTYDVDTIDDLAVQLEKAIDDPLAATRQQDLAQHVAQLERSYLLDYGTMDSGFFRRGPDTAARMLVACLENSTEHMIELQAAGKLN